MNARIVAAGIGALAVLFVGACGSDPEGTGAAPGTTVRLGTPNFITVAPIMTSTTTVGTIVGAPGATVPGEQLYTVVPGDVVVLIARNFCVDPTPLADYNEWAEGYLHSIFPGDVVKIPPGACAPGTNPDATTAPTAAPPAVTTTTFDPSVGGTYIVAEGDTLYGIADKTGTTAEAIVAANGWEGVNHVIYPGLQIKLPAQTG